MQTTSLPTSLALIFILAQNGWALPIDWNGEFGVETTILDTYTRIATGAGTADHTGLGSQIIPQSGGSNEGSFQSYTLKLRPTIIVNDAASLFAEITTGYASGGHFGQGIEQAGGEEANRSLGNALYYYNTYRDGLNLGQLYAKFYSDTATYVVGRQPLHWGLGAILNDGKAKGARFASVEDGIMAHLNLGNFRFSPYYMKAGGANLNDSSSIKSTGIQTMYRSSERDMSFGLLFGQRKSGEANNFLASNIPESNGSVSRNPLGSGEIKIIDIYFQKGLKKLNMELEIPLLDGELGEVYSEDSSNGYEARGIIGKATYEFNSSWKFGLDIGHLSGDNAQQDSNFQALYLHPSYHIAHLMFRYNMYAINGDNEENIFDSSVTNAMFTRLLATYRKDKWLWNFAFVWARANETAQDGIKAFHHERNIAFSADGDQSSDYGFELDVDFQYNWNSNVSILGSLGYHIVGNYYSFDNNLAAPDLGLENAYAAQLKTIIHF